MSAYHSSTDGADKSSNYFNNLRRIFQRSDLMTSLLPVVMGEMAFSFSLQLIDVHSIGIIASAGVSGNKDEELIHAIKNLLDFGMKYQPEAASEDFWEELSSTQKEGYPSSVGQ